MASTTPPRKYLDLIFIDPNVTATIATTTTTAAAAAAAVELVKLVHFDNEKG